MAIFLGPERPRSHARWLFPSPLAPVRTAHDAGTGKRKAGPLWEGETQRANARGFAMDIKLIAKPLMVKTQAKESQKHIGGSKPSHLGDPLRQFLLAELVCCSV